MCNHGTHVAGIIASADGVLKGLAPESELVSVQVFSRHKGSSGCKETGKSCVRSLPQDQLAALDWILKTASNARPIAAVNMSLAGTSRTTECPGDIRADVISRLREKNILTVVAAGNLSKKATVGEPGCLSNVITVGAVDTKEGPCVSTSNTAGDSGAKVEKCIWRKSNFSEVVDVLAPGVGITSAIPKGMKATDSGTSMAAAVVSGAIAALQSYLPVSSGVMEGLLEENGVPTFAVDYGMTSTTAVAPIRPRIDLFKSFEKLDGLVPSGAFVSLRDTFGDTGEEPNPTNPNQPLWNSPDIWNRTSPGECLKHQYDHQNPLIGKENFACIRVNNSGKENAEGRLEMFVADGNFDNKASWTRVADERITVPKRRPEIVQLSWSAPEATQHSLLVRWTPDGTPLNVIGNYIAGVRDSNDLIWKNMHIVDSTNHERVPSALVFEDVGDRSINMVVDVSNLKRGQGEAEELGVLELTLGGDPENLSEEATSRYYSFEGRSVVIPLKSGVYYIPEIVLPLGERAEFKMKFRFRDDLERNRFPRMTVNIMDVVDVDKHKRGELSADVGFTYEIH